MTTPVWHLYMLRLPSGMLYTGITTDVARRMAEHQAGKGELTLAFHCPAGDRSTALRLEYRVKQLSKIQKERLVSHPPLSLEYLLPG
ncbi:GIY-YIG nuclease family protein [Serratia marcescens]|uniref:GIY-YIG nuclease family protein n=1 Tax=Serratia marcescens TaxID=615 RepID=UPI00148C6787|nr:GIY-YIG nuclease family protein [Serratia marcescens]QJU42577.1 GIY-YIG nuclease family protein [Serratia marcescens]